MSCCQEASHLRESVCGRPATYFADEGCLITLCNEHARWYFGSRPIRWCSLYRLWGAGGELLYVGISKNALARLGQHAQDKSWWVHVVGVTIEHHPSREIAEEAERRAIVNEKPRHNVAGT
ncbi:MAG TPA: GIY-YIG nuclease family protein [Miltoncostaeaceae bacterium]|nr:GIY-YIG nuclease family protein [Miltoncostaeaceae bacterium]